MAQIVLRISTNEGADVLVGFAADKIVNNVSSEIGSTTTENDGVNGKSFATGYLSLSDGYLGGQDTKLQSEVGKYNGFMFGATDNNGNYELTLSLEGSSFDKIIIVGDKNANQFPTRAILDEGTEQEKIIYSDDISLAVAFNQESSSHTIKFTKWNRINYNACFTTIKVMAKHIDIDNSWIDNVESLSQNTSDPSSIQYSVLANSGSATIRDLNGEIRDYIENGIIPNSGVGVGLFINGNKIQEHLTYESDYNTTDKSLSISMTNRLNKLNSMYSGRCLTDSTSAYNLLCDVLLSLSYTQNEIDNIILCSDIVYGDDYNIGTVAEYLKTITIPYPYLETDTYNITLSKFCTLAQLQCYANNNGYPIFVSARPIIKNSQLNNAIKINKYLQISEIYQSLFKKNKYDGIDFSKLVISDKSPILTQQISPTETSTYQDGIVSTSYYNLEDNERIYITCKIPITEKNYKHTLDDFAVYLTIEGTTMTTMFNASLFGGSEDVLSSRQFSSYINAASGFYVKKNDGSTAQVIYDYTKQISDDYLIINIAIRPFSRPSVMQENTKYYPWEINSITIYCYPTGTTIDKSFEIKNGNNPAKIEFNELFSSPDLAYSLEDRIKNDYKNGIATATVDVFINNLYNSNQELIKDWSKGEILEVGDIVYFENNFYVNGSQIYWKITGRKFKYSGSPTLSLELQEVVVVE